MDTFTTVTTSSRNSITSSSRGSAGRRSASNLADKCGEYHAATAARIAELQHASFTFIIRRILALLKKSFTSFNPLYSYITKPLTFKTSLQHYVYTPQRLHHFCLSSTISSRSRTHVNVYCSTPHRRCRFTTRICVINITTSLRTPSLSLSLPRNFCQTSQVAGCITPPTTRPRRVAETCVIVLTSL